MNDFENKVVWVTGSSRGIGAGIAKAFAMSGATVVLHYGYQEGQAQACADWIFEHTQKRPFLVRADLTQEDEIRGSIQAIKSQFGQLDILINNAGISIDGLLPRFRSQDMDRLWQVNLKSAALTSKHAFLMLSRSAQPSIIQMSSIVGLMGNAGQAIYAATKAGIIALTKSMAKEFASRQIRVNAIAPGFIQTDMTAAISQEARQSFLKDIPLGRLGTVEDIAHLCLFLASSQAAYITGQTFVVDGGLSI